MESTALKRKESLVLLRIPPPLHDNIIQFSTDFNTKAVENYYNLVNQADTQNSCLICMEVNPEDQLQKISGCTHVFCKQCLHNYCLYAIKAGKKLVCPYTTCQTNIEKSSPCYKQLPQWAKDRFDKIKLHHQNMGESEKKLCSAGTCKGLVDFQDSAPKCDSCRVEYCTKCKLMSHGGKACQQAYTDYFRPWGRCPSCKHFVEKTETGNQLICTCKTKFCAVCKAPWSDVHENCQEEVDPMLERVYNKDSIMKCCKCWNFFKGILYVILLPFILFIALIAVVLTFFCCIIGGFIFSPCYSRAEGYATWATIVLCPCIGFIAIGYAIKHFLCQSLKIACDHLKRYCLTIRALFCYSGKAKKQEPKSNKFQV